MLDFMQKSKLHLKKLYTLVSHFLKKVVPNRQAKKKARPQKYDDALIITLWLFQILNNYFGSSFKLLREDLARKASVACAILWNFWVLATYLFLLFLSGILQYSYAKGYGRFLEQPHGFVFLEQSYSTLVNPEKRY